MGKRKNPTQTLVLQAHPGRPLKEILQDAYERAGTLEKAAEHLDISVPTFRAWMKEAGLKIDTRTRLIPA